MINELIRAFFFIFAAEMGDKTQILAMTFATRYSTSKVLLGVMIGSALNHSIAVILGSYLSNIIPINTVQIIAGLLFVAFGLWTLRDDEDEEDEGNKTNFGPVMTVAMAFFIGELGDKTQLTAMTLAVDANYPLFILLGTVIGMIVTSGLGIYIGSKIGKKIPEAAIKLGSAGVFIFFGTVKLFQTVPQKYINYITISLYFIGIGIIVYILIRPLLHTKIYKRHSSLKEAAATLYDQAHQIKEAVDKICLGEEHCKLCKGEECLIGRVKKLLDNYGETKRISSDKLKEMYKLDKNKFDKEKSIDALSITLLSYLEDNLEEDSFIDNVRRSLEMIIFGESIPFKGNLDKYFKLIKEKDPIAAQKVINRVEEFRNL